MVAHVGECAVARCFKARQLTDAIGHKPVDAGGGRPLLRQTLRLFDDNLKALSQAVGTNRGAAVLAVPRITLDQRQLFVRITLRLEFLQE